MKKIYIVLTLLLAGGLIASAQQINGDMNHDSKVDVSDVSRLIGTVLGTQECEYISSQINGDMNKDGKVDVTDLSALISTVLGERDLDYISSGVKTYTVNGVSFKMIDVAGGTYQMGGTEEQGDDVEADEKPVHSVTLSSFSIGETEVTQALWVAVMGTSSTTQSKWWSGCGLGDNYPVYCATWSACNNFISQLNALTGETFRMPTEAEWEYAARGGNKSKGYKYAGGNNIGEVAWYNLISHESTHEVATKVPNELGLYDMSGNVAEWCSDWYGAYPSTPQTNPDGTGATSGTKIHRGGDYANNTRCRVSCRRSSEYTSRLTNVGFRLVK